MNEKTKRWQMLGVLALTFLAGCRPAEKASTAKPLMLLTAEEAKELRWPEEDWLNIERDRQIPEGPHIRFSKPSPTETGGGPMLETVSPTDLEVSFELNQAPVDMHSLTVRAGKGIFWKDLTSRLEPYIDGDSLSVESLEIPAGRFKLEISIADVDGRTTTSTYRVRVSDS